MQIHDQPVLILGAGVSGLTTGICLAEAGRPVRVWTAEPPRRTTSVVAGALWGPSFQEPMAKTHAWTEVSLREFTALATNPDTGVRLAPALIVGRYPAGGEAPPQVRIIPELRACTDDELPPEFQSGFRARMPLMDMPRYLDYLERRLVAAGGEIELRRLGALADASDAARVVINCTGLGARELTNDPTIVPVFGQHVIMTNPGLDGLLLELAVESEFVSYFPQPDRVICGGIRLADRWDSTPDPDLTDRIVARCRHIQPRLRDAEVIEVVTGLRPERPSVRVEAEPLGSGWCVHNYGHGGNGVSLSWGCAREACELALNL